MLSFNIDEHGNPMNESVYVHIKSMFIDNEHPGIVNTCEGAQRQAGFRESGALYQFHLGEARFDLLPFGPGLVTDDRLTWPDSGRAMSTLGFTEAFEHAEVVPVAEDLSVSVVPIPCLVLLKIIAYQDRPSERVRDLRDIVDHFEHYQEDGERRFEIGIDVTIDGESLEYEYASAYLLGLDVAAISTNKSVAAVRRLLGIIADEYAAPIRQILSAERRIETAEARGQYVFKLFRVFGHGLEAGRRR